MDLAAAVIAAARMGPAAPAPGALRPPWPARLARAAAAALLAAGIGHLAGRLARPAPPPPAPVQPRQVAGAMHLDVLAAESPAGLSGPILTVGGASPEVER